jgi:transcription initiation factor TFIIB
MGCGLVISDHIIDQDLSGRRSFSTEEKAKRETKGSPINALMPDIGLSTIIDVSHTPNLSQRMRRIFKWNTRMTWSKRNMLIATTEIKRIGTILNIPQHVKEYAAKIYRKAFAMNLLRGRSIKAMVAAIIYYVCRVEKVPRTLQEIMELSPVQPREVRRCYRTVIRELNLTVPNIDPVILIPKFITSLDLTNDVEKTALLILKKYMKMFPVGGKDPKGLIAAAIYLASQHHGQIRSQNRIAQTLKITEVTLRSRFKEMQRLIRLPKNPGEDRI